MGWGLRVTRGQRVTDMIKTKVYELKLGARYIWQVMHGETLREHFNEVLSSVFEVLVGIPAVLGVPGCRCLMQLGGSARQSEISDLEVRYGIKQINFDQKSVRDA